ncbi:hypothetical protein QFZ51_003309 [Chitinophaga sp. W3I9]|jgi:hypothetical protein|nr:hypothetical protein [Chitinophaga ginsengisegetis]MDR6650917.1 hypothetical protein [Chitinophaga ginsengisegetis]MDR6657329.1 hypothetical protein [Chitinophaga ginsengisegetis]
MAAKVTKFFVRLYFVFIGAARADKSAKFGI